MPSTPIKVLSALPVVGHPRDSLRIDMLVAVGCEVEAVAFQRDYHSGRLPNCEVTSIGTISHGRYLERIVKMLRALPIIRRAMRRNALVYASGADMAAICLVAGFGLRKPVALEIGDVRELQVSGGLVGRLVRKLDKWMVESCGLLVVTAPRFLDVYYRKWLGANTRGLVIENKLESDFVERVPDTRVAAPTGTPITERPLRIGYFGLIRDEWSWKVLQSLAASNRDGVEVVVAGLPMAPLTDIAEQVARHANISYVGEYRSPEDLPSLYNDVDMVWACYPPIADDDWNLKWARPNRFYQSCYFGKPMFTRAGCQDAVDVERYDIGMIVDESDVQQVATQIAEIQPDDVARWTANMANLPQDVYMYTTESEELGRALRMLVSGDVVHDEDERARSKQVVPTTT